MIRDSLADAVDSERIGNISSFRGDAVGNHIGPVRATRDKHPMAPAARATPDPSPPWLPHR